MTRPNLDKTPTRKTLFQCSCSGGFDYSYVELNYDEDDDLFWFHVICEPPTILHAIRNWFRHKTIFVSEVLLSKEDLEIMHQRLGEFLKK